MTNRSLYPNNVVVDEQTLTFTEDSKSQAIRDVYVDIGSSGILSGGVITPATNPTLINVSACRGRTPNGELIELPAQSGKALVNYTEGFVNYVYAVYTEQNFVPRASAVGGNPEPTRALGVSVLAIMTLTEYTFLPTSSSDMTAPARDRMILLGTVTAPGQGAPITSSNIQTIGPPLSTLGVRLDDLTLLPGLSVLNITSNTLSGDATLTWNGTTLTYEAPTDSPGVAQTITTRGTYVLPSGTAAQTMTVYVNPQVLPQVAAPLAVTVQISDVYGEEPSIAGSVDREHRLRSGNSIAGVPNDLNPHGADLYSMQNVVRARGAIEVGTTLEGDGGSLSPRFYIYRAASTASVRELISVTETETPNMYIRRYVALVGGEIFEESTVNARWLLSGQWQADVGGNESTYVYTSSDPSNTFGVGTYTGTSPFAQSAWSYRLQTTSSGLRSPQLALPQLNSLFAGITFEYNSVNQRSLIYTSVPSGGGMRTRMFMRADGGVETVTNADWNGSQWVLDNIALIATRQRLGATGFVAEVYPSPGGPVITPFSDSAWYTMFSAAGTLTAPEIVSAVGRPQSMVIPCCDGTPSTGSSFHVDPVAGFVRKDNANGGFWIIPLSLPQGAVLTSVILSLSNVSGSSSQANVHRTNRTIGTSGAESILNSPYNAFANGDNNLSGAGFVPGRNVISPGYGYIVILSSSGGAQAWDAFTLTVNYTVQEYT